MMTFVAVLGGILVANVIWTVAMMALMRSKKVQKWIWNWNIKTIEKSFEHFEEEELN